MNNNLLLLDESWTCFNDPAPKLDSAERKPTYALIIQGVSDPKEERKSRAKKEIGKKFRQKNARVIRVIKTKWKLDLTRDNGKFTLKNKLAEFKNFIYILPDYLFTRVIVRKRLLKTR